MILEPKNNDSVHWIGRIKVMGSEFELGALMGTREFQLIDRTINRPDLEIRYPRVKLEIAVKNQSIVFHLYSQSDTILDVFVGTPSTVFIQKTMSAFLDKIITWAFFFDARNYKENADT